MSGAVAPRAGATSDRAPGAPTRLTVDDDAWPLAVTDDPAFGWVVDDADRGEIQTAYEITVSDAASTDASHRIADSQEVTSSQQSYVHVAGLLAKLTPDHSYWWTVRTWDRDGKAGPAAPLARFDTGIADSDWHASWIRRPGAGTGELEDYSLVRKQVAVTASPVVRARVYASAGHHYQLRINGARLAIGPSYAYTDEQYYETTDVTANVKAGAPNVFAFISWWGQPGQGRPPSVPALIARITIDHADGTRQVITTDGTWRTHKGMWIQDVVRNDEGDFVEHIDERLDPVGWDRPGFDDRGWTPAAVLGPHPTKPFTHLFAARTHIVFQRMRPTTLRRLSNGAYVADFGAVISATPVIEIHHGTAGARVTLTGGYNLDPNGHVSTTYGNQDTNMAWHFDERAGAQELRPFSYLAFRYLEIAGANEPLTAADVHIDARHADLPDEHAASFTTSDPTLNAVWNLARHSALYDVQEQFLDTPTRERGQFLGDAYDVSQATTVAFDERDLTEQALRDFARSQARYWSSGADFGRVNVVYPNGDEKRDIPDATQTYIEWVWRTYMTTGDKDLLASLYPVVHNISDYIAKAINPKTGLVTYLPGGESTDGSHSDYLYGAVDWPQWMRYGYDMNTAARTMQNALAVEDFALTAQIGQVLGKPANDVRAEQARAAGVTHAMQTRLVRPDGVFIDGLEADGSQSKHASQQANAWPLAMGVVPPADEKAVADYVVSLKNKMGVVYFRVLLDALHAAGRDQAFVAALTDPRRPGYANILAQGATFTWESWLGPHIDDSQSHGWGSTVLAVMQDDLLGVRTTVPGSARVDVQVPATTVTSARGVVATQRGPIPIAWTRDAAGRETIDITVPANVTAVVHLDATSAAGASENGGPVAGDAGVASVQPNGRSLAITIGSGHYVFANAAATHGLTTPAVATGSSSSNTGLAVAIVALVVVIVGGAVFLARRRRRRTV